jgi:hypothetical protein
MDKILFAAPRLWVAVNGGKAPVLIVSISRRVASTLSAETT